MMPDPAMCSSRSVNGGSRQGCQEGGAGGHLAPAFRGPHHHILD